MDKSQMFCLYMYLIILSTLINVILLIDTNNNSVFKHYIASETATLSGPVIAGEVHICLKLSQVSSCAVM
jgi:hypothetical protein